MYSFKFKTAPRTSFALALNLAVWDIYGIPSNIANKNWGAYRKGGLPIWIIWDVWHFGENHIPSWWIIIFPKKMASVRCQHVSHTQIYRSINKQQNIPWLSKHPYFVLQFVGALQTKNGMCLSNRFVLHVSDVQSCWSCVKQVNAPHCQLATHCCNCRLDFGWLKVQEQGFPT